jgi:hypothetical protein
MVMIVLVGPICIPFFLVPHMEWMFWGWLRAFIRYSFYQVVANSFVFAQLRLHFLDLYPPPFDSATITIFFVLLVVLLLSLVYGVLKTPSLVNSFLGPLRRVGPAPSHRLS